MRRAGLRLRRAFQTLSKVNVATDVLRPTMVLERWPLRFDTSETRAPPSVLRGPDEPTLSGPQASNRG